MKTERWVTVNAHVGHKVKDMLEVAVRDGLVFEIVEKTFNPPRKFAR